MSGTSQGYVKTRAKLVDKLGSEEAYMAWKRSSASKGGKNGVGHLFGHGKVDPSVIGKIGGARSKRRPKKV